MGACGSTDNSAEAQEVHNLCVSLFLLFFSHWFCLDCSEKAQRCSGIENFSWTRQKAKTWCWQGETCDEAAASRRFTAFASFPFARRFCFYFLPRRSSVSLVHAYFLSRVFARFILVVSLPCCLFVVAAAVWLVSSSILLSCSLSAGESGKSTLFKQCITLYGKGFADDDRVQYKRIIHNNVITSMKSIIQAFDVLRIPELSLPDSEQKRAVVAADNDQELTAELAEAIRVLWNVDIVKVLFYMMMMRMMMRRRRSPSVLLFPFKFHMNSSRLHAFILRLLAFLLSLLPLFLSFSFSSFLLLFIIIITDCLLSRSQLPDSCQYFFRRH